jgi:hypothetical protein
MTSERKRKLMETDGQPERMQRAVGYLVEARMAEGEAHSPIPLADKHFVTGEWRELNIYLPDLPDSLKTFALGAGMPHFIESILPASGLLTYDAAQAVAWMFLSNLPRPSKYRVEIRLVQYEVKVHTWRKRRGEVEGIIRVDPFERPRLKTVQPTPPEAQTEQPAPETAKAATEEV